MNEHTYGAVTRRKLLAGLGAGGSSLLAGCSGSDESTDRSGNAVVVSSKGYTEQRNLGYLAYELLDSQTNRNLVDETGLGGNQRHAEAYQSGSIHVYYDYMGSLWSSHPPQHDDADFETPDAQYDALKEEMESEHPIRILDRANWQNTWAPFISQDAIAGTDIESLSDLAEYVNNGNYDIDIAYGSGFRARADGLDNLMAYYGFNEEAIHAWEQEGRFLEVASGPATGTAVEQEYVDLGFGYSTSAWLADLDNIVLLEDDQNFWPFFHPVGVVHDDVATEDVISAVNLMTEAIPDAQTMQTLNARAETEGPQTVMRAHLQNEGFL